MIGPLAIKALPKGFPKATLRHTHAGVVDTGLLKVTKDTLFIFVALELFQELEAKLL